MKGSNITKLDHLTAIAEQTGDYSEIEGKPFPGIVAHVWEWFLDLSAGRGQGGISYTEIKSWMELTGNRPTPFEIRLIKRIDIAYLKRNNSG
ncbi:MAG: hypothetical protein CL666_08600 [Balneola sp.]|nr:hypothetical protein [Balneola sp.]|tara:strand:+ start:24688 stop:24963 length:276 start_codon:yes stop_codon:yes gene_type:complete